MSSCACAHHGPHHQHASGCLSPTGQPVALDHPMYAVRGRLICADTEQMLRALALLPDHSRLSRAEPGCLRFDLWQDEDPLIWHLSELFISEDGFRAHQARLRDGDWGQQSQGIARDFTHHSILPHLRPERPSDHAAINALLTQAFDSPAEARLVRDLRAAGDLAHSIVADAGGLVVGHVALSPLDSQPQALALAPIAVAPKAQGLGIGTALMHAALEAAGETPVTVLGDPAYYRRFGFRPADLRSPYAGPDLLIRGDLAAGTEIRHAPAFAAL